ERLARPDLQLLSAQLFRDLGRPVQRLLGGRRVPQTPLGIAEGHQRPAEVRATRAAARVERRGRLIREKFFEDSDGLGGLVTSGSVIAPGVGQIAERPAEDARPEQSRLRRRETLADLCAFLQRTSRLGKVSHPSIDESRLEVNVAELVHDGVGPRRGLEQLEGSYPAAEPLLIDAERSSGLDQRAIGLDSLERHAPRLEILGGALVERQRRATLTTLDRVLHRLEAEPVPGLAARGGVADELLDDTAGPPITTSVTLVPRFPGHGD